jgi:hypothetical protein
VTACKSAFHNQHILGSETKIREINQKLRKNRSALRTACPLGKATVRKDFLRTMGMDFRYYTHTFQTKNKVTYYFCYDYGYSPITDQEKVLIIQWQPYMDAAPEPVPPMTDIPLPNVSDMPVNY